MFDLPSSRKSLIAALLIGVPFLVHAPSAHAADSTTTTTPATPTRTTTSRTLKASDMAAAQRQSAELRQKAHEARLASIEQLKNIIRDTDPPGDQKAEMLLRLSDLYFEEGRELYLDEMQKYQDDIDKCFNTPNCKPDSLDVATYTTSSRQWQDRSIKLNRQILENYPQFARADEATFYLGQTLSDTNQKDLANAELTRLVKQYPDSKFVPDAYLMIGEYWFEEKKEAFKALSAYQKASAYKDFSNWAFATYKLAWCFYNVGEYGKAIDTMKTVVAYVDPTSQKGTLRDEALKDLVRFFADAGDMDEAVRYFTQLGEKDKIKDLLKTLASTYIEQGKFDQAVEMYRRLISENPTDPKAPDFQNEIIGAYTKMGKKQETIDEINRMLKTYGKNSSWAKANASNQDALKGAADNIEKQLRTVATNYHNEAKKLGSGAEAAKTYNLAEQAYRTYLQEYPESQYSYDVRYAFSELLYKVKKFDEAYDQYMKVVSIDKNGAHSQFCAESAIFAADEMLKKEKAAGASGGPDPGKKTDAVPLSDWEQKSLAALDQFAQLWPDDKKTNNVIYKSAYLLYNKNHFKEASDRFNVVIKKNPQSKEAEQASNLILDSFALVEDWENLKSNAKLYYDQQGLGSADFKKDVYGIYENASLKLIEVTFKKGGDKAKGAADYWAFYQEFPASSNADLALNNASVYYHELGRTGDAVKVRQELIAKFPKSKFYKDQVASLGFDYESMADFANAANWYEKLHALDKTHPGSSAALYSAALFRISMGQWELGIKNYQQYIADYPTQTNLNSLNIEIGKIYEEHEKWPEASKVYQLYFTKPPANATLDEIMFCRLHYGLLMDKLGQGAKVGQHWKDTLDYFTKAKTAGAKFESSTEYVAQIMYILAQPKLDAFMAMKIKPADHKMAQKAENKYLVDQLVAKAKAMQDVETTFTQIISIGAGEWGLASLTKLGQAYENMSDSLKNSAAPSYLTADQLEIYRMQLEDKAFPQIEKAVSAYSEALKKAYELNLYNDNTAYATRRLGELRPDDYPGLFEQVPDTRYSSPSVTTATFESEP
jgi:tetratricopeptide (TPR) repeat protein